MLPQSKKFVARKYKRLSPHHYSVKLRPPFTQINHVTREEAKRFTTRKFNSLPEPLILYESELYSNSVFSNFKLLDKYSFVFAYFDTSYVKSKERNFLFKFVIITSNKPFSEYNTRLINPDRIDFIELMKKHYCFYAKNVVKSIYWPEFSFYGNYCIPRLSKCEIEKIYSDDTKMEPNVNTEGLCCIRIKNTKDDYFTKKVYNVWRTKTYNLNSKKFKDLIQIYSKNNSSSVNEK